MVKSIILILASISVFTSCDTGIDVAEYVEKKQLSRELGVINVTINEYDKLNIEKSFSASYEYYNSYISDENEESMSISVSLKSFESNTYVYMGIINNNNTFILDYIGFRHYELTDEKKYLYSGGYNYNQHYQHNKVRLISFNVDTFDREAGKISGNGSVTMLDDSPLLSEEIEYTVKFNFDLTLRESI